MTSPQYYRMTTIDKTTVQGILANEPETLILDVREPDEFAEGNIPKSVNVPVSVLQEALELTDADFASKYGFKKPSKDTSIVLYCRSGRRSTRACDVITPLGFTKLRNYTGGWMDWAA
jgi:rhodanese-related sulfurtransferase